MNIKNLFVKTEEKVKLDNEIFNGESHLKLNIKPVSESEKTWSYFAHLSAFLGYMIPFGHILGPFLIWNAKKDESEFVANHAKAALNFQITFTLFLFVAIFLYMFAFGFAMKQEEFFPFLLGMWFFPIIFFYFVELYVIVKAISATSKSKKNKYPFTINFI